MRGWIQVAYVAKPKNLNGGLVVRGAAGLPFLLFQGLQCAVVPPQLDVPRTLTLASFEERAENEVLAFFEEVRGLDAAQLLAGCSLLVCEADVDLDQLEEASEVPQWEGWHVYDASLGYVGNIVSIDDRAMQPLITVQRESGEQALIPLVEEFIVDLNVDDRRIDMVLPAGLLEL